jgi:hypothetical protein
MNKFYITIGFAVALFSTAGITDANPILVNRGSACMKNIASCNLQKDKDEIVAVMHFLYQKGVEKNNMKNFESGATVKEAHHMQHARFAIGPWLLRCAICCGAAR